MPQESLWGKEAPFAQAQSSHTEMDSAPREKAKCPSGLFAKGIRKRVPEFLRQFLSLDRSGNAYRYEPGRWNNRKSNHAADFAADTSMPAPKRTDAVSSRSGRPAHTAAPPAFPVGSDTDRFAVLMDNSWKESEIPRAEKETYPWQDRSVHFCVQEAGCDMPP